MRGLASNFPNLVESNLGLVPRVDISQGQAIVSDLLDSTFELCLSVFRMFEECGNLFVLIHRLLYRLLHSGYGLPLPLCHRGRNQRQRKERGHKR